MRKTDIPTGYEASAELECGWASFRRISVDDAEFHIEFNAPLRRVQLVGRSLKDSIEEASAADIAHTRRMLQLLGTELARQLSAEGRKPEPIETSRRYNDERTWTDTGGNLIILGTVSSHREKLRGFVGVSDAALVEALVTRLIQLREHDLHRLYTTLLSDVVNSRARAPSDRA